ncbi:MAG: toll/interleukin-1 receptor domain-containing protein, partial [Pseudomonadota bacterium]
MESIDSQMLASARHEPCTPQAGNAAAPGIEVNPVMIDVFVAFHPANLARAERIIRACEQAGFRLAWSARTFPSLEDAMEIDAVAAEAGAVIALWSKEAYRLPGGRLAMHASIGEAAGRLAPVRIDRIPSPLEFETPVTADLSG